MQKIQSFWLEPWTNPFGKNKYQTFNFFNFVILECKNAFFLSRGQTHFPGLFCLKYNTPLEKSWFFDFFNFLFLIVLKCFLLSRITSNTFCWLILPKIKPWKIFKFLTKTIVYKPLSHFSHPSHLSYLITQVILVTPVISVISSP